MALQSRHGRATFLHAYWRERALRPCLRRPVLTVSAVAASSSAAEGRGKASGLGSLTFLDFVVPFSTPLAAAIATGVYTGVSASTSTLVQLMRARGCLEGAGPPPLLSVTVLTHQPSTPALVSPLSSLPNAKQAPGHPPGCVAAAARHRTSPHQAHHPVRLPQPLSPPHTHTLTRRLWVRIWPGRCAHCWWAAGRCWCTCCSLLWTGRWDPVGRWRSGSSSRRSSRR